MTDHKLTEPIRVALTVDPELPVPPRLYGGIERVVDVLARGLVAGGHEVSVFANSESATAGRLVPWLGRTSAGKVSTILNAALLTNEVMRQRFDLVHSFSRIAYLTPILPLSLPKIMTYQRAISLRPVSAAHAISQGTLSFTAVSDWMIQNVRHVGDWHVVPNAVSLEKYEFEPSSKSSTLVFLGRVEEIKGPHLAIEIAKRSRSKLIIAGNIPEEKRDWVERNVFPHVDGDKIRYIGPVDDRQKNSLLREAHAFLMPILWDEPFGIVMIEAMACGTPVLGLNRGSVREVVDDGVTGYVRDNVDRLIEAVPLVKQLDRRACRMRVERFYSDGALIENYLRLYRNVIASPHSREGRI